MPGGGARSAIAPYYSDEHVTLYHSRWEDVPPDLLRADVLVTPPAVRDRVGRGRRLLPGQEPGPSRDAVRAHRGRRPAVRPGAADPRSACRRSRSGRTTTPTGSAVPGMVGLDKRVTMEPNDQSDCELAWTNIGGSARMFRMVWNGGGVLRRENQRRGGVGASVTVHPTQKPLALMRWALQRCPPGTVLDPYAGSGTTLVAAKSPRASVDRGRVRLSGTPRWPRIGAVRACWTCDVCWVGPVGGLTAPSGSIAASVRRRRDPHSRAGRPSSPSRTERRRGAGRVPETR